MQYNKNTLTPIADAARFFSERNGRITYEETADKADRRLPPGRFAERSPRHFNTERKISA